MGMIGNQLAAGQALTVANDSFNGDGSTTSFTLSQTVGSVHDIEVLVDNVQQSPYDGSYSVSGTTLTFSGTPSTGTNNIYVIYNASKHITTQQVIPDDGSVHSSKIASGAVTSAKLHTDMDLSTKNVNPITMSTGTDKMQMAIQSAVSNRFAIRSTHTADYDNNPFIIYQPTAAGAQNDALVISAEGYVTQNKLPSFQARVGTNTSNVDLTGGDQHRVNYNNTTYNNGNHFSTSTNAFTAPVSGMYIFTAGCQVQNINSSSWASNLQLRVNGSHVAGVYDGTSSVSYEDKQVSAVLRLSVNDSVEVVLRVNTSARVEYSAPDGRFHFSGSLIG